MTSVMYTILTLDVPKFDDETKIREIENGKHDDSRQGSIGNVVEEWSQKQQN